MQLLGLEVAEDMGVVAAEAAVVPESMVEAIVQHTRPLPRPILQTSRARITRTAKGAPPTQTLSVG